jgi:hypothetical protein
VEKYLSKCVGKPFRNKDTLFCLHLTFIMICRKKYAICRKGGVASFVYACIMHLTYESWLYPFELSITSICLLYLNKLHLYIKPRPHFLAIKSL